ALLRRCADNLPGDYKPDSHSWGGTAASELLQRLRGTPLEADANRIFEQFLTSGSADEARLAQNYVNPGLVSVAELERATARGDLPADVQRGILSALARALAAQPKEFQARHRALLSRPGSDALVGAVIVADHTWFLAHVTDVLGADANGASNRLWYGLQQLNGAEATRLRAELDGRRAQLGDAYVQALVETIDGEAQDLAARLGAVRWPAVSAIP
ncbi:MAG TPA: hypothetical protein VF334_20235, partial [Polyangia bacterium]